MTNRIPQTSHEIETSAYPASTRVHQVAKLLFIFLCLEAIFAIGYRSVYLVTQTHEAAFIAGFFTLLVTGIFYRFRELILHIVHRLFSENRLQSKTWFWMWLTIGLALRLLWVVLFPAPLKSDGLAYFATARALVVTHHYPGAFWPPGFPLVLSLFFEIFGAHEWVSIVCALFLFAGVYAVAYALTFKLSNKNAAGYTAIILAIWPGYLTTAGINSKEGLIAFLLPAAMLLYLKSTGKFFTAATTIIPAGLLVGLATLTQPGCILFPAVILVFEKSRKSSILQTLLRTALFAAAMLIVILPWTYRNHHSLHRPVFISANGGSVFYRANNPRANASYSPEGEMHLPQDEDAADREGFKAGKAWIKSHPGAFAILVVRKEVVYLGDDGIGIYETLKRGLQPSAKYYAAAKGVSSLFWLGLWVLLLLGSPYLFRRPNWWLWYGLCFLPILYQWAIDSVFESGSRHHVSDVAFIAVLVGIALNSARHQKGSSTTPQASHN